MSQLKNKFLNRMFRRIGGLVYDLTTGALGVRDANGIYTLAVENDTAQVVVNPLDQFGMEVPAYAFATKLDDVNVGDIVVGDSKILGFVVKKTGASLTLLDKNGMQKQYNPPKVALFDVGSSVLVVRNLMNMLGSNGLAGLQGNLMPLLMLSGDGDLDLDGILPFMLMQQQGVDAGNGLQSMLPFLLMSKKGGSQIDPLMLMAMGGFGGAAGGAGMNPMMLMALMGGLGENDEPIRLDPRQGQVNMPTLTRI